MDNLKEKMEEKLYNRNFTRFGLDLNPVVSILAVLFVFGFALYAFLDLEQANELFNHINDIVVSKGDWLFILSSNFFIGVCLYLAFSKLGNVKIGDLNSEPEFTNFAWYSMLISAGMGIGLMFWGVGEPLYHSQILPPIFASTNSASTALATTFLHWGLHPWSIYALTALALAFFAYNQKLPLSLRSVFYPLLKDKVFGIWGDLIDVLTVVACLFGLATSLGFGVQQINSGLNYLIGLEFSIQTQIFLIIGITSVATISVVSGIQKGVRFLSELNIKIAFIFMVGIFLLGPTAYIFKVFSNSLGIYINDLLRASFFISIKDTSWQGSWTVFYLAWWISWSPFVGMFIARISHGRTIREFILAVMIIPSFISFIWLTVFGATAISVNTETKGQLFEVVQDNLPVALFEMINLLQLPIIATPLKISLSVLATLLIFSFFITSSDSGSLVVTSITSGGKLNSPVHQKVFWAFMQGLVAAVLLLIGGEQAFLALQTAVISTGLPFTIILIMVSMLLVYGVNNSYHKQKKIRDIRYFERVIKLKAEQNKSDR